MNVMTHPITMFRVGLLSAAVALAVLPLRATAQEMDHSKMQMPVPATPTEKPVAKPLPKPAMKKKAVAKTPSAKPASKTTDQMDHPAMGHDMDATPQTPVQPMDHSVMGHDMPMPADSPQAESMDHSTMTDMAKPQSGADESMQGMDHSAMGHDMSAMPGMSMAPTEPITPIPALTDADRAAAVPPAEGHTVHDNSIQRFVLVDRLEAWNADPGTGMEWEGQAWFGTDLNRLWLRSEGERSGGTTEAADLEVLYGRSIARWWDVVAGVRHDFKPGASQDFAAIGIIGLAPQKFEVEATAYIGERGQTAARFEAEYDLLLTNRLILQPLVETNLYGKDDPQRGIGSGLGTIEAGFRLRYEFIREFAPYIGIVRERAFGGTADLRRGAGEDVDDTRLVAGIRIWF